MKSTGMKKNTSDGCVVHSFSVLARKKCSFLALISCILNFFHVVESKIPDSLTCFIDIMTIKAKVLHIVIGSENKTGANLKMRLNHSEIYSFSSLILYKM